MKRFFQSWAINTVAVLVAVYLVPGIQFQKWLDVLVAALVLGILNAVIRPILLLLALPLLIFTLGLFTLVINAGLLYFVGFLLKPHFYVDNFWNAFWGALTISVVSLILNVITGNNRARVRVQHHRPPSDPQGGGGPVIDV